MASFWVLLSQRRATVHMQLLIASQTPKAFGANGNSSAVDNIKYTLLTKHELSKMVYCVPINSRSPSKVPQRFVLRVAGTAYTSVLRQTLDF